MPIEWTAILLLFLSSRWVYLLAKKFDKPRIAFTAIAIVTFLVGGSILAFVATFTLLMIYGEFAFNYEMLVAGFFTVLGTLAVGIYYLILRRVWKKQQSASDNPSSEVIDN